MGVNRAKITSCHYTSRVFQQYLSLQNLTVSKEEYQNEIYYSSILENLQLIGNFPRKMLWARNHDAESYIVGMIYPQIKLLHL